jgi:Right handed beta helix region
LQKTNFFAGRILEKGDIEAEILIEQKVARVMKTNFNQPAGASTPEKIAVVIGVFLLPLLAQAALPMPDPEPAQSIHLSAGATDAQIQSALDALPAAGGEVVLAPGRYEIGKPLVLQRDHLALRGSGGATVLHLADNANCPAVILGEPVNNPTKIIRHLTVAGFFIDGNRFHQQRELWRESGEGSEIRNNGITVQSVEDCAVENVAAAHCRSGGLVTTLGVRRLNVNQFESFDNEFDGLACYLTEDSIFANLNLHDNPGAGISLDLAFNHNVVSNAWLNGNDLGIFMRASRENRFLNVSIRNSHHHGVFMAHSEMQTASGWGPAPKTECSYNAFTNLVAMNCGGAAFRVNNTTCTNNIIIRPKFAGNAAGNLSQAQPNLVAVQ